MIQATSRSLRATAAIAAVLALGSTPAFAQDASAPAPVIDLPAAPAAVAPATPEAAPPPRIVLPDVSDVTPAPEPAAPADAVIAAQAKPTASRTVAKAAASAPRVTRTAVTETATRTTIAPVAASAVPANAPLPASTVSDQVAFNSGALVGDAAQPQQASKPAPIDRETGLIVGGLAALLGIAGAGAFLASRRRRPADESLDTGAPTEPLMPLAEAAPVMARAMPTPAPAWNGASISSGPVPTGEAREALLSRMVAAAPDAANPFVSNKARRRRARIILQGREQRERNGRQPFDFRNYSIPAPAPETASARTPAPVPA